MISFDTSDEKEILNQAKAGNLTAFEQIYRRYLPMVYRRICYVIPKEDVEDVTQEVFVAVIKSLPNFRGDALFSTWLRTLTNRKVAEYYRQRSSKGYGLQVNVEEADRPGDAGSRPSRSLEERIALRNALNRISERHREIILLRFAEGLQFNQIAEVMGMNLEATKSLFRRAICALREYLD